MSFSQQQNYTPSPSLYRKTRLRRNDYLSGSEYLLRMALYRENLENSSESLTTCRPRATALLMSSSEESSAFFRRDSRTCSLNHASPDGCRRAARINLLQRFLTKGCISERSGGSTCFSAPGCSQRLEQRRCLVVWGFVRCVGT